MTGVTGRINYQNKIMKNISNARQRCAKVRQGAKNTFGIAVATPTESGVFACPEYGQGGANRETARMAIPMFLTPCPPNDRKKSLCGFQFRIGDKTMPQGTPTTTPTAAPTKSIQTIDLSTRMILIDISLTKASQALHAGSLSKSLGATLSAGRHLKQAITKATTSGRAAS
ncbi:MAG: hypothetical protein WCJ49_02565 [Deltaproteobacteria bacterium]